VSRVDEYADVNCRICGGEIAATWHAHEMMHGTGEAFDYAECSECGCVQISKIPANLGRYYGDRYYSVARVNPLVRAAKEARLTYLATGRGLMGRLMTARLPRERDESVAPQGISKNAHVLEVGCGNGYYLLRLFELGYRRLWGIDPFIDARAVRTVPVRLECRSLLDVDPGEGPVDAVLFNHSLEHIAEQHETIERARELLGTDGLCIVRIPTVSSWAWEHYRCYWVQLDAPRHLYLHSRRSLALLASQHGFEVERLVDDSTAFQFWGSEQYVQGVSLRSSTSWHINHRRDAFTPEQIREFEARAAHLNRQGRGDQFAAFLRRADG